VINVKLFRSILLMAGLGLVLSLLFHYGRQMAYSQTEHVQPSMLAPNFRLPVVKGGVYHLTNLKGQVVLMSFVNARPTDASLSKGDTSRSQIVFLKSIEEQYGLNGVLVLIVDATTLSGGQPLSSEELVNLFYDWNLDPIPVLMDTHSCATAQDYSVFKLPTTILIAPDGRVSHRWDGFASANELAFALQSLVGLPNFDISPTLVP
jgi:peroxiredoxin